MRRRHQELAAQFGNQPTQVVDEAEHHRAHHVEWQREPADAARRAVTFARDRNLEREAVVEERAILRDALQRSIGDARIEDISRRSIVESSEANSSPLSSREARQVGRSPHQG
jgi:hypothetical protein